MKKPKIVTPAYKGDAWKHQEFDAYNRRLTRNRFATAKTQTRRLLKMAAKKGGTKASPYVDFTFSLNHHPGRFKHGVRHSI